MSSVDECKAECDKANEAPCEFNFDHWEYDQVGPAGFGPTWTAGDGIDVFKCTDSDTCGCINDGEGKECSSTACHRGCELAASSPAIQGAFFNGQSVTVDPRIGLNENDLLSALQDMKAHVDGSSPLTITQLRERAANFVVNQALLDVDFPSLDAAMDLVSTYESMQGPLFLNSASMAACLMVFNLPSLLQLVSDLSLSSRFSLRAMTMMSLV